MSDDGDHLTLVGGRRAGAVERFDEQVARGDTYALTRGQRQAIALQYLWPDERFLAVPYSHEPMLWYYPPDLLMVEYPGYLTVALRGHGLGELARRISERRVTWVRECPEEQATALPLAVTRIDILRTYFPSRTASGFAAGN